MESGSKGYVHVHEVHVICSSILHVQYVYMYTCTYVWLMHSSAHTCAKKPFPNQTHLNTCKVMSLYISIYTTTRANTSLYATDLGEESVEAVDFLPLLHIGIVLSDPLQSQLIHQIDGVGCAEVTLLERGEGEKGGEGDRDIGKGRKVRKREGERERGREGGG